MKLNVISFHIRCCDDKTATKLFTQTKKETM